MSTPSHPLDAFQGPIRSRVGVARGGEYAVFRGQDIHRDLADINWVEMYVFGVTGRRWCEADIRIINALMIFTSYPDSRIWNNRVAALAGTARSTGALGVSAAQAVSEARIFGGQIFLRALDFLRRAQAHVGQGGELESFVAEFLAKHRSIAGFGRPLVAGDERIPPTWALLAREGRDQGPLVSLVRRVETILQAGRWRLRMNYAALAAATFGDLGMTPWEFYFAAYPAFLPGMGPCYQEALEKPVGAFMPLACTGLNYTGPAPRTWPPISQCHGA